MATGRPKRSSPRDPLRQNRSKGRSAPVRSTPGSTRLARAAGAGGDGGGSRAPSTPGQPPRRARELPLKRDQHLRRPMPSATNSTSPRTREIPAAERPAARDTGGDAAKNCRRLRKGMTASEANWRKRNALESRRPPGAARADEIVAEAVAEARSPHRAELTSRASPVRKTICRSFRGYRRTQRSSTRAREMSSSAVGAAGGSARAPRDLVRAHRARRSRRERYRATRRSS